MTQFAMCRAKNGRPIVRALHPDGRQVLLHSGYDPEREAARLVDSYDLAGAGAVAVLGLGLGYHVGEILRRVDKNTPVAVIEKSPELVVLARKKISFLPWQRLVVLHTEEDIKSFALSSLHVLRGKRLVLVEHPPSVGLDPEFYDRMRARLRDYISFLLVEVNTSRELNRDIQHNLMANLPLVVRDPGIVALKGPFAGRPAVIVAAGPSLARNVHLLHEARDRALLLCVGTAWKVLAKENIQPDLVVTLDPTAENFCHFEGMNPGPTFLCYEPQTFAGIPPLFGERRFVYNAFQQPLQVWLRRVYGSKGEIQPGGSVAIAAFEIACFLDCNPVIFVGQDLAYTGGYTHARGTVYVKNVGAAVQNPNIIEVPAIGGGTVYTSRSLHSFLVHFEELFAREKHRLIIDATEGGAWKRGTEVMPFREVLNRYLRAEVPVRAMLETAHSAHRPAPETAQKVAAHLKGLAEEYRRMLPDISLITRAAGEALAYLAKHSKDDLFDRALARYHEDRLQEMNRLLERVNSRQDLLALLSLLTFDLQLLKKPDKNAPLPEQLEFIKTVYGIYQAAAATMVEELEQAGSVLGRD